MAAIEGISRCTLRKSSLKGSYLIVSPLSANYTVLRALRIATRTKECWLLKVGDVTRHLFAYLATTNPCSPWEATGP
jgi:hypothetical protein